MCMHSLLGTQWDGCSLRACIVQQLSLSVCLLACRDFIQSGNAIGKCNLYTGLTSDPATWAIKEAAGFTCAYMRTVTGSPVAVNNFAWKSAQLSPSPPSANIVPGMSQGPKGFTSTCAQACVVNAMCMEWTWSITLGSDIGDCWLYSTAANLTRSTGTPSSQVVISSMNQDAATTYGTALVGGDLRTVTSPTIQSCDDACLADSDCYRW